MKNFILFCLLFCFGVLFASPPQASPPATEKFKVEASQNVSCVEFCEFALPSNEIFQDFKNVQCKQNNAFLSQNPAAYLNGEIYIKTPLVLAGQKLFLLQSERIFHTLTPYLWKYSKIHSCSSKI